MLDERSIGVIDGQLVGDESWVYVWLQDREILYVGATRLPLGARTWLHLTDDDPAIGKIRAHHPEAMKGHVTVRGWQLPGSLDRSAVRDGLSACLTGDSHNLSLKPEEQIAVEEIAESIRTL